MTIAKDQDIAGDNDVKNTDDGWSKGYSCAGRELKSQPIEENFKVQAEDLIEALLIQGSEKGMFCFEGKGGKLTAYSGSKVTVKSTWKGDSAMVLHSESKVSNCTGNGCGKVRKSQKIKKIGITNEKENNFSEPEPTKKLSLYKEKELKVFGDTSGKGWNNGYKCTEHYRTTRFVDNYDLFTKPPPIVYKDSSKCTQSMKEKLDIYDTNKDGKVTHKSVCAEI